MASMCSSRRDFLQQIGSIGSHALMWKFNTEFVVSNGFRFCPPLVPAVNGEADITNEYLWSMLPGGVGHQGRDGLRASPRIDGRAVATDAPADLLSQVDGTTYRFT
jgi:hypothetical protein